MVLKTFNVSEDVYSQYSGMCKSLGISMSKQIELFMRSQVSEEPEARPDYIRKLEKMRNSKFIKIDDFASRYGLK
jgi:hypothetical protein